MVFALNATARGDERLANGVYAVDFRIPDGPGPGVYFVPTPGVLTRAVIGRLNSGIAVYVK